MNILVVEASGAQVALVALETVGAKNSVAGSSISHQTKTETTASDADTSDAIVRAVWSSDDVRSLSRVLTGRLAELLENANWTLSDVDALAVGLGPGSWTSLRVVLATCKTLAQARDWKLVGVPSFDGIARAAWQRFQTEAALVQTEAAHAPSSTRNEALIVVAAPSRAGEIYSKTFRVREESWITETSERVQSGEELRQEIQSEKRVIVTGEAAREIVGTGHSSSRFSPVFVDAENAALQIGILAAQRLASGDSDDALTLQPLYVALSAAERNLAKK